MGAHARVAMGMANSTLYELQNSSGNRVFALSKPQFFVNAHQSKSIRYVGKPLKIK